MNRFALLYLFIAFGTNVQAQTHTFFQQISEALPMDTIHSIVSTNTGVFYLIGSKEDQQAKLYALKHGTADLLDIPQDFRLNQSTLTCIEGQLVLLHENDSFVSENGLDFEKLDSDLLIGKTQEIVKGDNIITASGYLTGQNLIVHNKLNQKYIYHNNKLYEYAPSINQKFKYWGLEEMAKHASLFAIPLNKNQMLVGYYLPNKIFLFDQNTHRDILTLPQNRVISSKNRSYLHAVFKDNCAYLVTDDYLLIRLCLEDLKLEILHEHPAMLKNIFKDEEGTIWLGSKEGKIFQFDEITNLLTPKYNLGGAKQNTFRSYQDKNGWIWWGFHNGIAVSVPESNHFFVYDNKGRQDIRNNISISAIEQVADKLFVGTYSEGMFELDYKMIESQIKHAIVSGKAIEWEKVSVKRVDYFDENNINEIEYLNSSNEIVGTRTKGAYYIQADQLLKLTKETGYLSGIQNFFSNTIENKIILSIPGGYCTLDLTQAKNVYPSANFTLTDVRTRNNAPLKSTDGKHYTMAIDNAYLHLTLKNNYIFDKESSFEYRINNGVWKRNNGTELIYAPEKTGDYTIEIKKALDYMLSDPLMLHVHVFQKWHKSSCFKIGIGIGLAVLLYYLYSLNIKEKKLQQNIRSLETESLRSYMNPHFISNSLNSINYYVLNNNKEQASSYLVKFARLIRSILNHTQNEYVSLSEEIDTLSLYLEMERLRFKEAFDYEVKISDNVSLDYEIPTMLIQPFLENAIWHGIMAAKKKGNILLQIHKMQHGIEVIILDNGIGISQSLKDKESSISTRKSMGLMLIKKRLQLLNELYNKQYKLSIEDRSDDSGTIIKLDL